jgi:spore germination protein
MNRWLMLSMAAWPALASAAPAEMAYYEDSGSLPSLKAEAGTLGIVAADLFDVDINGKVTGRVPGKVTSITTAHGITLLATVSNWAGNGFKANIATAVLTPGAAQDQAVAGMVAVAQKTIGGINVDFEAVPHKERALYTAFVQRLATALHENGRILVLSVPAKTADDPNDSWAGAYDYAALGGIADTLQVMTYDENGPWGPPGPVSGLDWMTACLSYAESVVPTAKISLGFPAYGYDWNLTNGGGSTIAWNQVPALIAKTGAVPQWDAPTSSPWFSYTTTNGTSHVVWYESSRSIKLKASLAANNSVGSVSVWALGLDDPSYWKAIAAGFGESGQGSVPDPHNKESLQ